MYRFLHSSLLRRRLGPFVLLIVVAVVVATIPLAMLNGGLKKLMAAPVTGAGVAGPHDLLITSPATLTLSAPSYMPGTPFAVIYGARVTLQKVVDNATAIAPWNNNRPLTPDRGQRFLGLQITVTNTGSTAMGYKIPVVKTTDPNPTYTAPGTDATMPGCQQLAQFPPAPLQPGQSVTACDVYSMPISDQVVAVTYSLGGFTESTANGQWTIQATSGVTAPTSATILSSLTLVQKPTTPLWKLDLLATLNQSQLKTVTCPAVLTVQSTAQNATMSANANVCKNGVPQANVEVLFPVFMSDTLLLQPNHNTVFSAYLSDAGNKNISQLTANITTPPPPVWVGVGDSYSSGHHQDSDGGCDLAQLFILINLLNYDPSTSNGRCGLYANDPNFSWVTHAVGALNNQYKVPPVWRMVPIVAARSGFGTSGILLAQLQSLEAALKNAAGSWNVVSLTGGANNTPWPNVLSDFYKLHPLSVPWDVRDGNACPDANTIVDSVNSQRSFITNSLVSIMVDAYRQDKNVRLVDVTYPYVDDSTSACFNAHKLANGTIMAGNSEVFDILDNIHASADLQYKQMTGGRILVVDSQALFGLHPLTARSLVSCAPAEVGFIQQTLLGYPHPNCAGQQILANEAVRQMALADGK